MRNRLSMTVSVRRIRPTMFICGMTTARKGWSCKFSVSSGGQTEELRKAEVAWAIETLCTLWGQLPGGPNT